MFIFGTRPEVIKLIPIIDELKSKSSLKVNICSTGQQKDLVEQMLSSFDLKIDHQLDVMTTNQSLHELSSALLIKISEILEKEKPDMVFVHGDTTTAFIASLAAFYKKISIAHIEAGLRTNNKYSPFPEEINRSFIAKIADIHYSPTEEAKNNLLLENIPSNKIVVTGNSGIDTLKVVIKKIENNEITIQPFLKNHLQKKFVLITFHRRENQGEDTSKFLTTLKNLAIQHPDLNFVFPVHLNPNVKQPIENYLSDLKNVLLLPPLPYQSFIYALANCYFVISDSGGVQEEATTLGKPLLLFRDTTERPEAMICENIKLVKQDDLLEKCAISLLTDDDYYRKMSSPSEVFGNGKASERIRIHLESYSK